MNDDFRRSMAEAIKSWKRDVENDILPSPASATPFLDSLSPQLISQSYHERHMIPVDPPTRKLRVDDIPEN